MFATAEPDSAVVSPVSRAASLTPPRPVRFVPGRVVGAGAVTSMMVGKGHSAGGRPARLGLDFPVINPILGIRAFPLGRGGQRLCYGPRLNMTNHDIF